jgi:hypothetical protein
LPDPTNRSGQSDRGAVKGPGWRAAFFRRLRSGVRPHHHRTTAPPSPAVDYARADGRCFWLLQRHADVCPEPHAAGSQAGFWRPAAGWAASLRLRHPALLTGCRQQLPRQGLHSHAGAANDSADALQFPCIFHIRFSHSSSAVHFTNQSTHLSPSLQLLPSFRLLSSDVGASNSSSSLGDYSLDREADCVKQCSSLDVYVPVVVDSPLVAHKTLPWCDAARGVHHGPEILSFKMTEAAVDSQSRD